MTTHAPRNETLEVQAIEAVLSVLERRLRTGGVFPIHEALKDFLRLRSHDLAQDVFAVICLDCKLRLIDYEPTEAQPGEIVRQVLIKDAAFVLLHHNHASGSCWPSYSDYQQAFHVRAALELVDVPVIDHVITSKEGLFSVVERGFS